jgi:hypothetical protein
VVAGPNAVASAELPPDVSRYRGQLISEHRQVLVDVAFFAMEPRATEPTSCTSYAPWAAATARISGARCRTRSMPVIRAQNTMPR